MTCEISKIEIEQFAALYSRCRPKSREMNNITDHISPSFRAVGPKHTDTQALLPYFLVFSYFFVLFRIFFFVFYFLVLSRIFGFFQMSAIPQAALKLGCIIDVHMLFLHFFGRLMYAN